MVHECTDLSLHPWEHAHKVELKNQSNWTSHQSLQFQQAHTESKWSGVVVELNEFEPKVKKARRTAKQQTITLSRKKKKGENVIKGRNWKRKGRREMSRTCAERTGFQQTNKNAGPACPLAANSELNQCKGWISTEWNWGPKKSILEFYSPFGHLKY